jgi:hypothetical protein
VTPLGPDAPPRPSHLASPIILQAVLSKPATPAGGCPAGWVTLSGPAAQGACFRDLGKPVTITSAAVSSYQPGNTAPPGSSGLLIFLTAAGRAALTAVTTTAYDSQGSLDVSVAGKTWSCPEVMQPVTGGRIPIVLPTNQALQLQHVLVPPS